MMPSMTSAGTGGSPLCARMAFTPRTPVSELPVVVKGKSEPVELFLLVGDESLARTADFLRLREAHNELTALGRGAPAAKLKLRLASADNLAGAVMPELQRFYARLAAIQCR